MTLLGFEFYHLSDVENAASAQNVTTIHSYENTLFTGIPGSTQRLRALTGRKYARTMPDSSVIAHLQITLRGGIMKTRTFVASLFAILVLSLTLPGQEFRSTISGMVTDSTGASIPGAKVIAREVRTGTKLESTTETSGQYTFAALLPGDYEVTVQATGFKAFLRSGLHIGSGDHAVIDIKMEVGDVATTVEVKADAPLLHSENGTLGQSITTKEV